MCASHCLAPLCLLDSPVLQWVLTTSFDAATVDALQTQVASDVARALGIPSWRVSVVCSSYIPPVSGQGNYASKTAAQTQVTVTITPSTSASDPTPSTLLTALTTQLADPNHTSAIYQGVATSQSDAATVVVLAAGNTNPNAPSSSSSSSSSSTGGGIDLPTAAYSIHSAAALSISLLCVAISTITLLM